MPFSITQRIQKSLQEESIRHSIDGWIFTNFSHKDNYTDNFLNLQSSSVSTRRWIYIVRTQESPIKIVHSIEKNILDSLEGELQIEYTSHNQLIEILQNFLPNKTFAILSDENIPVISTVDGGFISLLSKLETSLVSASSIIQRTKSLLSEKQIESHERASTTLYKIVTKTWEFISSHYNTKTKLFEKDVQNYILDLFIEAGLITDHLPIVAFGKNTANPHYEVDSTNNSEAKKGDIIQLDIWAKEQFAVNEEGKISNKTPVYADISWIGIYDTTIPKVIDNTFEILINARDIVYNEITNAFSKNQSITGFELDDKVRTFLNSKGYKKEILHRTGHGIDTNCHGSGVNLDSVEFPDNRFLLEGSCFSVEPGIYKDTFGLRTEINIYIKNNKPIISGKKFGDLCGVTVPQIQILTVKE